MSDDGPTPDETRSDRVLLGRFRVERILGRGGMGEVLLARDELLGRHVALKRLSGGGTDDERRRALLREARRIGQINDPRIASIYDVLELDDDVLLVMEYVEGQTLRQRMAEPMSLDAFWGLALPCADALAAAHAHGVIHRDIKPENLMVTREGRIKILDFGIARRSESHPGDTTTGADTRVGVIAGTPHYMAPEAFVGAGVTERADLFSLGVVFYELLTGTRPFEGDSFAGVLERMLRSSPPSAREKNPAVGPALSSVVSQLLARDQADRVESASELGRRLEQAWREDSTGEPRPIAPALAEAAGATRRARPLPRWPISVAAGSLLVAVAVAIVVRLLPTLPRDRNLAVLAPVTSPDPERASMAVGAVDWLSGRLQQHAGDPRFQSRPLSDAIEGKVTSPSDARRILGATLALTTRVSQRPDVLHAQLELWDTVHDRRVASREVDVAASEPFAFLQKMEGATLDMLQLRGAPTPATDAAATLGVRGAGTLRYTLQGLGRLRLAQTLGDAQQAVADFETAGRVEPDAPLPQVGLVRALLQVNTLGDDAAALTRAETIARHAVALDTLRADSRRMLGYVLSRQRDQQAALEQYQRARHLDPTDLDAWLRVARTYARLGELEREREVYEEVIRGYPHRWQPYWWLAAWHFRRGELDPAIHTYEEMIRRAPQLETGYASLGGALVLRGEYGRAIETLKRAVELRPTRAAYDNLGTAYFNTGGYDQAIQAYNQSFQFGLADYQSWLNLGDAHYWLRNKKADAAKAYEQSIQMGREEAAARRREGRPFDPMIPANLATVFPKIGRADSARVYLASALEADSANPMVQVCAALTYWQLNERPRAIDWLRRSVAGGYPAVWLRDSPVFREWQADSSFRSLTGAAGPESPPAASAAGAHGG